MKILKDDFSDNNDGKPNNSNPLFSPHQFLEEGCSYRVKYLLYFGNAKTTSKVLNFFSWDEMGLTFLDIIWEISLFNIGKMKLILFSIVACWFLKLPLFEILHFIAAKGLKIVFKEPVQLSPKFSFF